jgi:hypothetical protein
MLSRVGELRAAPVRWLRDRGLTIAGRLTDAARAVRASQQEDPAQVRAFVASLV